MLFSVSGDMEFKQNKYLPADKQIVTANPDINIVRPLLWCLDFQASHFYLNDLLANG